METETEGARLANERDFHNARFGAEDGDSRAQLDKWYPAIRRVNELQAAEIRALAPKRDVLEYGCADGSLSLVELGTAQLAGSFTGIDISDVAIARAASRATAMGIGQARYAAMNAEATDFPDASFDVIYGRGILHHLDLDRAYAELRRLLRAGGVALFTEPLGHNPMLNWYRSRTPHLRTSDEHPLLMSDIAAARAHFRDVGTSFAGLTTVAAAPFAKTGFGRAMLRALERLDEALLSIPAIRPHAWYVLLTLRA